MQTETLKLATQRRSIYALGKNVNASEDEVASVIKEAVRQAPTAFNSQTTRAVIAFGDSHDKVWDIVMETLRKIVPAESFASTEEKVNSFKAAFGTVLLFTDTDAVADLKENFPLYADNFDDVQKFDPVNGVAHIKSQKPAAQVIFLLGGCVHLKFAHIRSSLPVLQVCLHQAVGIQNQADAAIPQDGTARKPALFDFVFTKERRERLDNDLPLANQFVGKYAGNALAAFDLD